MSPYHGGESDFETAFRLNAAPLLARIEKLERKVKKLKRKLSAAAPPPQGVNATGAEAFPDNHLNEGD